ncbi:MAG: DHHA2 domain-containing protein [Candidatus Paceibacterota bacterium]|jgi:inorganic pyrophosphatase/exopolyphosphatase
MNTVVVTSYTEPDLDGYSCAVAYTEFLNKTGTPAVMRIFGEPHIEATYLVKKFGLKIEEDKTADLEKIILVDASELRDLDKFVRPENVIEVIDHRKVNDAELFTNAKIQIEFVGSAATLIAEKFYKQNINISVSSATLLYGAIVSNTLNFRAKVTTDRDRQMAEWLNQKLGLTQEFIDDMFRAKSDVSGEKLAQRIEADFAWFKFGKHKIGCAQLEIIDVKSLVNSRKAKILQILEDLKAKDGLDMIFMSFIDLGEGFNAFITGDLEMQRVLSEILNIQFKDDLAFRPSLIMRKEIAPLLKEKLQQ